MVYHRSNYRSGCQSGYGGKCNCYKNRGIQENSKDKEKAIKFNFQGSRTGSKLDTYANVEEGITLKIHSKCVKGSEITDSIRTKVQKIPTLPVRGISEKDDRKLRTTK